ncbi:MAG: putative heme-binding domain-containing protein [Cyclobacteriaceae bacterium]|jgi:putative heme-binding domain-containing protein
MSKTNSKFICFKTKIFQVSTGVLFLFWILTQCESTKETYETSIFNGMDFMGWNASDMGYWTIADGVIIGGENKSKIVENQFLWHETKVNDFYLAIEVKLEPNSANAGIQFRSVNIGGKAQGYQADAGKGMWGRLYHEHGRGKLDWRGEGESAIKPGQWNKYEILAVGHRIWTAINGKLSVSYLDPEGELEGYIGLQIHDGMAQTVSYRPLKLIVNPKIELVGLDENQLNDALVTPPVVRLSEKPSNTSYPPFANGNFDIEQGEVIAFLGQTNMVREQYHAQLETRLVVHEPKKKIYGRNISWEGDTVYEQWRDLNFGSWESQLEWINASMVIAQYGQTESFDGIEKIPQFIKAYQSLLDQFATKTKRIVLVSPMPFEPPSNPNQRDLTTLNKSVSSYSKAIEDLAIRRGLVFVDLFNALKNTNQSKRLTDNGMHLNEWGQEVVGSTIANILLSQEIPTDNNFIVLKKEIVEKNRIWFDEWRPMNWSFSYGDRTAQQFGRAGAQDELPLADELKNFIPIMKQMDGRIHDLALHQTPKPLSLPYEGERKNLKNALSPEEEVASFNIREGFQINLFASEADGIVNPVKMTWDERGRLWVACAPTYPQIIPGAKRKDYILICEDSNNDGKADKFTKFAEGLFMPMGIEFGDGGVYVCEGTQLIYLTDTDGDDKADTRKVILSGFGTGDAHQKINSISWGPSGELWFTQGHHIFSRVETPYGIKKLSKSSVWRYRPKRDLLQGFFNESTAGYNNWGVNYDDWGQLFHNSGADKGYYTIPGMVPTSNALSYDNINSLFESRNKTTGLDFIGTAHMPDDIQGAAITSVFLANKVELFNFMDDGSGFRSEPLKDPLLISSSKREFRVVDVKMGPDGGIYLCDWFNPVIGHYQASYNDPDRDYHHGRIWRLTAENRPLVKQPDLSKMNASQLLGQLRSNERWTRYQAKRLLFNKPKKEVLIAADNWVSKLNPKNSDYELLLYRVVGVFEAHEVVRLEVLDKMLNTKNYQVRAYAARLVGHMAEQLDNPLALLEKCIRDQHPRVRLEAVVSCSFLNSAEALEVAMKSLPGADKYINYALTQTVHALKNYWQPAFQEGRLNFSDNIDQLVFVVKIDKSLIHIDQIRQLVKTTDIDKKNRLELFQLMIERGNADDLRYVLNLSKDIKLLHAIEEAAQVRQVMPSGDLRKDIESLLSDHSYSPDIKIMAFSLAASWKLVSMWGQLVNYAKSTSDPTMQMAAIACIEKLDSPSAIPIIEDLLESSPDNQIVIASIQALVNNQIEKAAAYTSQILSSNKVTKEFVSGIVLPFLKHQEGSQVLAKELQKKSLPIKVQNDIMELIASTGSNAPEITQLFVDGLKDVMGLPEYSEALVNELLIDVSKNSNVENGKNVYNTVAISCSACHKIDDKGSDIGPELSAIGSSMPTNFIIESILWPQKDIKEGYLSTAITTKDNNIINGYIKDQDDQKIEILSFASKKIVTVYKDKIADRKDAGSAMPNGIVSTFSKQQFIDLVSYLEQLRGK